MKNTKANQFDNINVSIIKFPKGYEYIAKNKNCEVFIFKNLPYIDRKTGSWYDDDVKIDVTKIYGNDAIDVFRDIFWENSRYKIEEYYFAPTVENFLD